MAPPDRGGALSQERIVFALERVYGKSMRQSGTARAQGRTEESDLAVTSELKGCVVKTTSLAVRTKALGDYAVRCVQTAPSSRMTIEQKNEVVGLLRRDGTALGTQSKTGSKGQQDRARKKITAFMYLAAREILIEELLEPGDVRASSTESAKLLGIKPGSKTAIVLPAFQVATDQSAAGTCPECGLIDLTLADDNSVSDDSPPIKETMGSVYSLHDTLAAADLASIQYTPPIFTSAQKFRARLQVSAEKGKPMSFKDRTMDNFLAIGLFSSAANSGLFSRRSSEHLTLRGNHNEEPVQWPPFELIDTQDVDDKLFTELSEAGAIDTQLAHQRFVVIRNAEGEIEHAVGDEHVAVIARLTFSDVIYSVVGGIGARSTARVADYLVRHPLLVERKLPADLWDSNLAAYAKNDANFVALLDTPGEGDRFEAEHFTLRFDPIELPSYKCRIDQVEGSINASVSSRK